MPNTPKFELRLGDLVHCEPHGQALVVGAVDGSSHPSTFIVAFEIDDRVIYTLITQEAVRFKYEASPRLLRIKNASFGADLLATQAAGGAGH